MTKPRTQPTLTVTVPVPAIRNGRPLVPAYWAKLSTTGRLRQGGRHIRAIKDPSGVWNPRTGGWTTPPPGPRWDAHWSVRDLPNPGSGFYWLGTPSAHDGTLGSAAGTHAWAPHASTPHAPSWHSIFPFKPSVTAVDHYLPGGGIVHHPKGVNFNSHFIEHMWMDFGRAHRQPFTWLITACIASYPDAGYSHYLLDAGRDPREVGFASISDTQVGTSRRIKDNLDYRTLLRANHHQLVASANPALNHAARSRFDGSLRPRMFIGIFDGDHSHVGAFSPGKRYLRKGTLVNGPDQHHRHYVLGRQQNWISQEHASHLLVFDIRYWHRALTRDQLEDHYAQLSSTYQFHRYRRVN